MVLMSDRYQLAREFEATVMKDRVNRLRDINEVKEVARSLIDLNMGMKEQVVRMMNRGWLLDGK